MLLAHLLHLAHRNTFTYYRGWDRPGVQLPTATNAVSVYCRPALDEVSWTKEMGWVIDGLGPIKELHLIAFAFLF